MNININREKVEVVTTVEKPVGLTLNVSFEEAVLIMAAFGKCSGVGALQDITYKMYNQLEGLFKQIDPKFNHIGIFTDRSQLLSGRMGVLNTVVEGLKNGNNS